MQSCRNVLSTKSRNNTAQKSVSMLHTWQQAYNTVNVSQTLQRKLSLELQNEANYICCYRSVHLRHSTCPFIPLDTKNLFRGPGSGCDHRHYSLRLPTDDGQAELAWVAG